MGRTVSELRNSTMSVYIDTTDIEDGFQWEDFKDDVKSVIKSKFPSFEDAEEWEDENKIILENHISEIAISEYCGLTCISGRTKHPFGERFLKSVEKHLSKNFDTLRRVGRFSNGGAIYEGR